MIQRVSSQSNISALDGLLEKQKSMKDHVPEMKVKSKTDSDRSWEVNSPAQKLSQQSDILNRLNSIRSATFGAISNIGGSEKQIRSESNNTIFDPSKSSNLISKTSKEITKAEKERDMVGRKDREAKWKESTSPKIGDSDLLSPKIANASCQEGSKGWIPNHNMSIFDSKEYERLIPPPGEKIEKRASKKDNSWREPSKAKNIQDATNNFMEGLMSFRPSQDESSPCNKRSDAVDRLFSLFSKNTEQ